MEPGERMTKPAMKKMKERDDESRARSKAGTQVAEVRKKLSADAQPKAQSKKELAELRRRNTLIDQYMPFAASIANRVCQTLSSTVEYEEVLCNARLGLLEAAKRFDEAQEVDFKTFAYYRIKGAIYDGLRRSGWLPRTLYAKMKFEEAANEYLQQRSLYRPEKIEKDGEIVEGEAEKEVTQTVSGLASIYIVSLDASEDIDIEDENALNMEQRAEFMEVRQKMRDAIGILPEKEKKLVMMYYFQNKTLEEIGERMGLSKSWTSRLHARALALLFKRIKNGTAQEDGNELEEILSGDEE